MILKKMKSYLEKELGKKDKPKEICKVLKSLCLNSVKTMKSKIYLKKNCIIQFEPLENANTFKRFYLYEPEPSKKTAKDTQKITNQAIKSYYGKTSCNVTNELSVKLELSNVSEEVIKKTLLNLDISKATEMDQIVAKFLRNGAEILALPLRNIINLSIKLSTFPGKCKIENLLYSKNVQVLIPKTTDLFQLLPLVSKTNEKSIHFQIEDYLNKKKKNLPVSVRLQNKPFNRLSSGLVDRLWYY